MESLTVRQQEAVRIVIKTESKKVPKDAAVGLDHLLLGNNLQHQVIPRFANEKSVNAMWEARFSNGAILMLGCFQDTPSQLYLIARNAEMDSTWTENITYSKAFVKSRTKLSHMYGTLGFDFGWAGSYLTWLFRTLWKASQCGGIAEPEINFMLIPQQYFVFPNITTKIVQTVVHELVDPPNKFEGKTLKQQLAKVEEVNQ